MKHKRKALLVNTIDVEKTIIDTLAKEYVGDGYKMRTQPLSDDVRDNKFMDQFCATYTKDIEKYNRQFSSSSKMEQIQRWNDRIESMKNLIQETINDASITEEAKTAKIKRCVQIIADDEFSIRRALEFLERRSGKEKELLATLKRTR